MPIRTYYVCACIYNADCESVAPFMKTGMTRFRLTPLEILSIIADELASSFFSLRFFALALLLPISKSRGAICAANRSLTAEPSSKHREFWFTFSHELAEFYFGLCAQVN
jgi:hypothetical protein